MMIKNKKPPKNEKNLGGFRSSTTSNYLGLMSVNQLIYRSEISKQQLIINNY